MQLFSVYLGISFVTMHRDEIKFMPNTKSFQKRNIRVEAEVQACESK
jgi:hypothetical protein